MFRLRNTRSEPGRYLKRLNNMTNKGESFRRLRRQRWRPASFGLLVPALVVLAFVVLASGVQADADTWTTHRHDVARSGVSAERITVPLKESWVHKARHRPQPAWPGPARRDGWHKVDNLKARVIFDWAFHVVADESSVYFGSSADDKLYCLDADTGKIRWSFFTDGPIRLAPTVYEKRIYIGSDDGLVYCLQADTGKLVWKYQAAPSDYQVPGNGRLMSVWPVRTGVLVDDEVAYFCAGLFAFEGAYLCALQADDGKEIWKKKLNNISPQGYMLASKTRLYVPMGYGTPAVFDRTNGNYKRSLGGRGGAFCVLTDEALIYGPGLTGQLEAHKDGKRDQIASFNGNQIVVTPKMSYLHTDTELSGLDRVRFLKLSEKQMALTKKQERIRKKLQKLSSDSEEKPKLTARLEALKTELKDIEKGLGTCEIWREACKYPYALVLAGDILLAGGTNGVAAFSTADGQVRWTAPVTGRALDIAVSNGRVIVSTDQGLLHCFKPQ